MAIEPHPGTPAQQGAARAPARQRSVMRGRRVLASALAVVIPLLRTVMSGQIRPVIASQDQRYGISKIKIPMQNGVPTVCLPDPAHGGCAQPFHNAADSNVGAPTVMRIKSQTSTTASSAFTPALLVLAGPEAYDEIAAVKVPAWRPVCHSVRTASTRAGFRSTFSSRRNPGRRVVLWGEWSTAGDVFLSSQAQGQHRSLSSARPWRWAAAPGSGHGFSLPAPSGTGAAHSSGPNCPDAEQPSDGDPYTQTHADTAARQWYVRSNRTGTGTVPARHLDHL